MAKRIGMECRGCGELFSGEMSFNKHRVGSHSKHERRCLTVDAILAEGLTRNERGLWTTHVADDTEEVSEEEREEIEA